MNVIIIHGAHGHPNENWFPWLKSTLMALHIDCIVPAFPTPDQQSLSTWLACFQQNVLPAITSSTVMIGHSLGAVFLLRALAYFHLHINTAILVGAFIKPVGIDKFDSINHSFLSDPISWDDVCRCSKQFVCYHGLNDPYVDDHQFHDVANALSAKKIMISNGGHLNLSSGYDTFPHLLREIKNILSLRGCFSDEACVTKFPNPGSH